MLGSPNGISETQRGIDSEVGNPFHFQPFFNISVTVVLSNQCVTRWCLFINCTIPYQLSNHIYTLFQASKRYSSEISSNITPSRTIVFFFSLVVSFSIFNTFFDMNNTVIPRNSCVTIVQLLRNNCVFIVYLIIQKVYRHSYIPSK